jgi:hypothetical protein
MMRASRRRRGRKGLPGSPRLARVDGVAGVSPRAGRARRRRRALRHGRPQRLRGLSGAARDVISGAGNRDFISPYRTSHRHDPGRATFVRPGAEPRRPHSCPDCCRQAQPHTPSPRRSPKVPAALPPRPNLAAQ